MLTKVKSWIDQQGLLNADDKVVVACSGGPDSMALLDLLLQLRADYQLTLVVAHVDHMFRGQESAAEAEFVGKFCATHQLVFRQAAIDVMAYMKQSHLSAQEAARQLRYQFLRQVATELGGAKIATGHHQDDQAETVLLNLCRGAGCAGLKGIEPEAHGLIRPLLTVSKEEIEEYCQQRQLVPCRDSSNKKTNYRRNFLRQEIMPLLVEKMNSNLVETLCRTARLLGDEQRFLVQCAREAWPEVASEEAGKIVLSCGQLAKIHLVLRREIIRLAIEKLQGHVRGIGFFHVEQVLVMAAHGRVGSRVDLPGSLVVWRNYEELELTQGLLAPASPRLLTQVIPLDLPGETKLPGLAVSIQATLLEAQGEDVDKNTVYLDWDKLVPPFWVRFRQTGDNFQPAGMTGHKTVKRFFIDAKVPQGLRDQIPLIGDSQGIIWIAGLRSGARGKPSTETKRFLRLCIV
jgi:tRNA(Ile)-lysidine synthase